MAPATALVTHTFIACRMSSLSFIIRPFFPLSAFPVAHSLGLIPKFGRAFQTPLPLRLRASRVSRLSPQMRFSAFRHLFFFFFFAYQGLMRLVHCPLFMSPNGELGRRSEEQGEAGFWKIVKRT